MRNTILALTAIAVVALGAHVVAEPDQFARDRALDYTRVCIPVAGEVTQLSVSSSAGTGLLDAATVYSMVCTVDVYWETADAANPTADSSSDWLPKKTLLYFGTGAANSLYMSAVDTAAAAGTCYVHKCR